MSDVASNKPTKALKYSTHQRADKKSELRIRLEALTIDL